MWRSKSKSTQGLIYSTGTESEFLFPPGKKFLLGNFWFLGREISLQLIIGKSAPITLGQLFLKQPFALTSGKTENAHNSNRKKSNAV